MDRLNDETRKWREEFDRVQADLAAVDDSLRFLVRLKANLLRERDDVMDRLAVVRDRGQTARLRP